VALGGAHAVRGRTSVPAGSRGSRGARCRAGGGEAQSGGHVTLVGCVTECMTYDPIWPFSHPPQQDTRPVASSAHAKLVPAETCTTPSRPGMVRAVERDVVVPSPSCPSRLSPQHATVWLLWSAQAKSPPRETELASPMSSMRTGPMAHLSLAGGPPRTRLPADPAHQTVWSLRTKQRAKSPPTRRWRRRRRAPWGGCGRESSECARSCRARTPATRPS
jgi:hypothetical protein